MPKLQLLNTGNAPVSVELIKGDAVEVHPGENAKVDEENIRPAERKRLERIGLLKAQKTPIKDGSVTADEDNDDDNDGDNDGDSDGESGDGGEN